LGISEKVTQFICFLFDIGLRFVEPLLNDNRRKAKQHGVQHTDHGIDEARHVIVSLKNLDGDPASD